MARVRRKANATMRWNFEDNGAGRVRRSPCAVGHLPRFAAGTRRDLVDSHVAHAPAHVLFGAASALFPILIAVLGAIVFLEINVPRMIASLGTASLGYFIVVDTAFGSQGGIVGDAISRALRGLVGDLGATIVLTLAAIIIGVAITNVSVKKVIRLVHRFDRCFARAATRAPARAALPEQLVGPGLAARGVLTARPPAEAGTAHARGGRSSEARRSRGDRAGRR